MKRALVAAVGSLLFAMPGLADESPAANTSVERVAAAPAPAVSGEANRTATSAPAAKPEVGKSRRASADDAANKGEASHIKQLPLKALNDDTVCRKEYPTGSRIGVRRCYSRTETASSKVQNEIMLHDIQEMRDRQMYEQLQRSSIVMTPPIQSSPPGR